MPFRPPPAWMFYGAIVLAVVAAALGWREYADTPGGQRARRPEEGAALASASRFDPSIVVKTPDGFQQPTAGTAFSISAKGVWLTARHVINGCGKIALMEAPGRAAEAELAPSAMAADGAAPADIAVLLTRGGAPALSLAPGGLHIGERAFHPGFPQGRPGEATSRLIGRQTLMLRGRIAPGLARSRAEPVLAWAEAGRTSGLRGDLAGLSGAPVLNARGQVVALTLAEAPRRGRIYTTAPEALRDTLARARIAPAAAPPGKPVTVDNYGRIADALRRNLSIAQVVCLDR